MRVLPQFRGSLFKPQAPREEIVLPVPVPKFVQYEEVDSYDKRVGKTNFRNDRSFAPYQPGEILLFAQSGTIRMGRVVMVGAELLSRSGYFAPRYKVQYSTKTGHWSKDWIRIYSPSIWRAYHDAQDRPRLLPPTIESISQLSEIAL